MTRHPGFSYDAARKRARFDCYVPGSAGRSRRRTVFADTRPEALALWRKFVEELSDAGSAAETAPAAAPPDHPPTLPEFVDAHFTTIAVGLKRSTQQSHRSHH